MLCITKLDCPEMVQSAKENLLTSQVERQSSHLVEGLFHNLQIFFSTWKYHTFGSKVEIKINKIDRALVAERVNVSTGINAKSYSE